VSAEPILEPEDQLLDAGPADDEIHDPSRGSEAHLWLATLDGRSNGNAPAGSFADRVVCRRVDLLARIRHGLPEIAYVPGSSGRYVQGRRHYVPGPKKLGKTFVLALDAVDIPLAGGRIVILDRENGANLYASRLEAIMAARGLDEKQKQQIADGLSYFEFPRLARHDETDFVDLCRGADLVGFDSQRMFLSDLDLDENDSDDYATFMAVAVDPLFRAGIATLILDNAGHSDPKRGRGSSSKADLNEILFTIDAVEAFDAHTTGRLRLDIAHSRLGTSGRWELEIGGGVFGSWHRIDDGIDDTALGFRPTALMERASIFIENCTAPPTRRTITDEIGGKGRYARIAIDVLVREGYARGAKGQGVESIKPYRQADDPGSEAGRNG
jgi:hypothetical protein